MFSKFLDDFGGSFAHKLFEVSVESIEEQTMFHDVDQIADIGQF